MAVLLYGLPCHYEDIKFYCKSGLQHLNDENRLFLYNILNSRIKTLTLKKTTFKYDLKRRVAVYLLQYQLRKSFQTTHSEKQGGRHGKGDYEETDKDRKKERWR